SLVRLQIRESLHEGDKAMLHKAEAAEPEDEESGDGECTPVPVEVLLDCLMEDTIAAIIMKQVNISKCKKGFTAYPLMVSRSTRSRKSPGSFGVILSSSRGARA
ncbi:MAG: hypothetical protein ACK56F_03940, partial [bacterium]